MERQLTLCPQSGYYEEKEQSVRERVVILDAGAQYGKVPVPCTCRIKLNYEPCFVKLTLGDRSLSQGALCGVSDESSQHTSC